jgi:hypothetical protein
MGKQNTKIRPIDWNLRVKFPLTVGTEYYISWGDGVAHPVKLLEFITDTMDGVERIRVAYKNGTNVLFPDELGRTPAEAIEREVTW